MAEPFLAELKLMSFNFPPKGWAFCNGQLLPINQNQALFALLGTQFGGNGQTNFALPDLRGRAVAHVDPSSGLQVGTALGQESHTLSIGEMPAHLHEVMASADTGTQAEPKVLASANNLYRAPSDLTPLLPATVSSQGGSQAHENRQPYLALNWCIALQGIFPSQN